MIKSRSPSNILFSHSLSLLLTRLHIRLKIELYKLEDKKSKKRELPVFETWERSYNPQYDAYDHDSYVFKTILARWIGNINRILRAAQKGDLCGKVLWQGGRVLQESPGDQAGLDRGEAPIGLDLLENGKWGGGHPSLSRNLWKIAWHSLGGL